MAQTIRVSLPGYNALTDTNLDHYALYADSDNILIKEYTRGSVSVSANTTVSISHNLSYIPFFLVSVYDGTYNWIIVGYNIYSNFLCWATDNYIYLRNKSSSQKTFKYYIFYDQIG